MSIVSDAFTRTSPTSLGTADTGQTWTAHTGTWGTDGDEAYQPATTNFSQATVDSGVSDGVVSVTITVVGGRPGIVFRRGGGGDTDCYSFIFDSNNSNLNLYSGRSSTLIGQVTSYTLSPGDIMSVEMDGTAISCRVNGTEEIAVTNAAHSGTRHGLMQFLGNTTARWDNFDVSALAVTYTGSGAVALPAFAATGAATFTAPTYTGTGTLSLPALAAEGAGTFTPPTYAGQGVPSLPALTASGAGTFTAPTYAGEGAADLPAFTATGVGTFSPPVFAGSGAVTLPSFTATGVGAYTDPVVFTGSGAVALPAFAATGTGSFAFRVTLTYPLTLTITSPGRTLSITDPARTLSITDPGRTLEVN